MKKRFIEGRYFVVAIGLVLFGFVLLFYGVLSKNEAEVAVGGAVVGGALVSLMFEITTMRHLASQSATSYQFYKGDVSDFEFPWTDWGGVGVHDYG